MWRAYKEVIHCVFDQIQNLQNCFTTQRRGGGLRQINTCRQVPLLVNIFKKNRHLGFGVFMDIWSMNKVLGLQPLCTVLYLNFIYPNKKVNRCR